MSYLIIVLTSLISIQAFRNPEWFSRLQFNAYQIYHRREYHRLLTHGFLHANWTHLIVNMLVLFFFGPYAERQLRVILPQDMQHFSPLVFLLFYLAAVVMASSITVFKQKDNAWYNAVGASGAVSAIIFFFIFFNPWELIYFYGILPIPGVIMGALYLIYSQVMIRRGTDNVNHDAHFVGAVFGFLFPLLINVKLILVFLDRLMSFSF